MIIDKKRMICYIKNSILFKAFRNFYTAKGAYSMTQTKKRIIIITASAIVLSFLLISSIFSALQFSTFNSFSSFPAFFRVISGSEDVIEVDGCNIMMCSPTNSVEKLTAYLKALSVTRKMIWAAGSALPKTAKKFSLQSA